VREDVGRNPHAAYVIHVALMSADRSLAQCPPSHGAVPTRGRCKGPKVLRKAQGAALSRGCVRGSRGLGSAGTCGDLDSDGA